jgi:hypothetical protein
MIGTELIIAFIVALLFGAGVIVNNNRHFKFQLILSILGTSYMLVHAILHPESNSKFFAFIGIVFTIQNFKKLKGQRES